MKRILLLSGLLLWSVYAYCTPADTSSFRFIVLNEKLKPVEGASVQLLQADRLVKASITDNKGEALFERIADGDYIFSVTCIGYSPKNSPVYHIPSKADTGSLQLQSAGKTLQEVSITARKPFVEQKQGKVVLNVDASVTNVGSTVLEVLEKSPGVTVDHNGGIALKGKPGVLVLIDDKPTYLTGADLNNLLSSMSSAQVNQIELIANPPAKYDASGNAGIINIKTKKNNQKGFNGSFTTLVGQGVYPKNTNNLVLNFRTGKVNMFLNYNLNYIEYLLNLYALRKYYDDNGTLTSMLDQPAYFKGSVFNNTIKTGLDYFISDKTTVGLVLGGTSIYRQGNNTGTASWLDPAGTPDSAIYTTNRNVTHYKSGSVNINARHTISESQGITVDFDWLHYGITTTEDFNNMFLAANGYDEQSRGSIPTTINIASGKIDYNLKTGKNTSFQAGAKLSHSNTDNVAAYQNLENGQWLEDDTKNNHFIYNENIRAVYSSLDSKMGRWAIQAGLRYEHTNYHADQLGNAIQKNSAFSRNYGGLFPSGNISYLADSSNTFTLTAGRRIDRPIYQNLNPFYFIINKYTYQTGNPFLLPQYSWNLEFDHQYKDLFTTGLSYSVINNYFSQIFLADTARGVLLYDQGNVGRTTIWGISEAVSVSPAKWWQFNITLVYNHKQLAGFNGNSYTSQIDQLNVNSTSQFTIGKLYTAEISGFYTTRARNDIQELLYPTGQLSLGLSRPVLNKKATLKLTARDIFYTNAMEGLTQFPDATEYFKEKRDTRIVTVSFTYRFGKSYKTMKHDEGSAADEAGRVGNG